MGLNINEDTLFKVVNWAPYSTNTFSGKGKSMITAVPVHHVRAHHVQGHFRNGKYISGFWRDGDGNTKVNTYRGYYAKNPNADPINVLVRRSEK